VIVVAVTEMNKDSDVRHYACDVTGVTLLSTVTPRGHHIGSALMHSN